MASRSISIDGMSCGHCVKHVTEALSDLTGVSDVVVSLADKNAKVEINESQVTDDGLVKAVEKAGYTVTNIM